MCILEHLTQKEKATTYIQSQKSLHLYPHVQDAFIDVLNVLSDEEFHYVVNSLELVVLHEQAIAQVMHFEPKDKAFAVLQLTFYDDMPENVLRWVIAHELGHVLQKRNWQEDDGEKLEEGADKSAQEWGFEKTEEIKEYLRNRRQELHQY